MTGSLRIKLIAWFFVPTAIILVAVALVNFNSFQNVTEDLVIERDRDLTQLWAGQLAANFDNFPKVLGDVSHLLGISRQSAAEVQASLTGASPELRIFDGGVVVLDTFGIVTAAHPFRPEIVGQDWSDRDHFRQMLRFPGPVFSDVLSDGSMETEVIEVAVPITGDQSQFLGSIVGVFDLRATSISAFYSGILRLRIGNGNSFIVDGNGTVIYHDDRGQVGADFAAQLPVMQVLTGEVGAIRNRDQHGTDQVSAFSPIPGTPWALVTEESWSSLTSGSRNTQRFLLLLLALGVAVPAIVVAFGVKQVMKPVEELKRAAKEVAQGNFGQTISIHSGDEIEELATEFNLMAEQLRGSYGQLEQRVVERTKELAASELRYRALFEDSRDAIFVSSTEGKFTDVNQAALDLFGFTREEIIGSDVGARYFDPEDQVRFRRELDEAGSVVNFEEKLLKKDGTVIDCEISAILRRDEGEEGGETQVQGMIRDVTQRKRSEQELREVQEAERELAEVTARLTETGRIVTANLDVAEVYERFAEEVKKLVDFDRISVNIVDHEAGTFVFQYVSGIIQPGRHAGDILTLEGTQTGEVVKTGKPIVRQDVSVDTRFQSDQTLLDMGFRSSIVVPLRYQDRIIGVLSLRGKEKGLYGPKAQSILEQLADQIAPAVENARLYSESQRAQEDLRQAEQKYRRIFDDSKDPIFLTSREGRILDVNQAGLEVFGYETDQLIGLSVREMCEDPEDHTKLVASVNAQGSVIDYEIRLLRKDGSVADCVVSLIAQRDDQNFIVAYQGIVRDITESKLAEAAALEQTREVAVLEERNRMAREIHDTMAQGFTGIVLQMEAAEQSLETSPGDLPDHLNRARALAREGLQEARRTVWGLVPQALAQSTLDEALQEEVRRFGAEGHAKIAFTRSGKQRELPPDVQTVLLRICQESLTNIRRHAEANKVTVNLDYDAREVRLVVQDDGVGFDLPAVQIEKKGASFGLIGMRQRADLIKGQLEIDSSKNQGTVVRL
ncbi:MAG: PAS domain S-box protein, partial [Chloroflexi bacterium]|nr:PAS domain S-box protein [Chloroflexota bacterium]